LKRDILCHIAAGKSPSSRYGLQRKVMAETRKLAAILAADVVGYSRLTGADEDRTLARLRALRSDLIDPTIAVHTQAQTVRQTVQFGSVTEVAEYDDGVYGPVSHTGITALIPSVHQFVHVNEELIYYGAEVRGVEEGAVLNKRLLTITLPNGKSGWCLMADKK
jgi:class 3 adenylate cyclase